MASAISGNARKQINDLIHQVVQKYLGRATTLPSKNSGNPFVMALLKDFEPLIHRIHGLKTSLGGEMEKIAEIIALDAWGKKNVERKVKYNIELPQNVFATVDSIMSNLSRAKNHPNYVAEKQKIVESISKSSKKKQEHVYEFDLKLIDPKTRKIFYVEMKGPDPNTTEVPGAKRRLLSAYAWEYSAKNRKRIECILGVYYNNQTPKPYKNYKVLNYFDPSQKGDLIVHADFWNFIGRNPKTFVELLTLFENYGKTNKKVIWDGFSKLINTKRT